MAMNAYWCEFCGEDFEADTEDVLVGDQRDGEGTTVHFCSQDCLDRYERGEACL